MDLSRFAGSLLLKIRFPRFPVAVHFTREGVVFVLLCLAIGAAAVNTGNNILYLIFSLMLAMIIISGIISRRMLIGLVPRIGFPGLIFCGVKNLCFVSVANRKQHLPSIAVRFMIHTPQFPKITRTFFYVPSESEVSGYAPFVFPHRGILKLREMELQTSFPFSFFLKVRRYFPHQEIRIYPKVYRFPENAISDLSKGMVLESPYKGESQQLLHLRDYTPYDSSRRIHWKASAKREKLFVKEFQREQNRDVALFFDCYPAKAVDSLVPLVEKAISFFASLAFIFREKNVTIRVAFPDRFFEIRSLESIIPLLDYLAELRIGEVPAAVPIRFTYEESLVLQVRSKRVPPVLHLEWANPKILYIEDWQHLLVDRIDQFDLQVTA